MKKSELSEILREKLSRSVRGEDIVLTVHLFFIEYAEELEGSSGDDIKRLLKSAGTEESYSSEYTKMRKIAPHVTLKASYPPE